MSETLDQPDEQVSPSPQRGAARRGRWWRRALYAVAALVLFVFSWYGVVRVTAPANALRIRIELDLAEQSNEVAPGALRIGTWNIAHGRGLSRENWNGESATTRRERIMRIASELQSRDLDIVVLNEVDFDCNWSGRMNQAALIAREAGYRYRIEQRNVDAAIPFFSLRFGNVVLSRYPIASAKPIDFPWYNRWQEIFAGKKRGALCVVELPGGRRVQIAPIHLDHRFGGNAVREESVKNILAAHDSDLPLVLAGDFNDSPPGFPGVSAKRAEHTSLSLLLDDGKWQTQPRGKPGADDLTFRADNPTCVIDWIIVPAEWRIVSREVVPSHLSDHRLVVMEVRIDD